MAQISINAGTGSFSAYLALPKTGTGPGIVVIQEIFGVNPGIRAIADRLAAQGFVACAPDLFWRLEPGVELNPSLEPDFKRGLDLMGRFDSAQGIEDIKLTTTALRRHASCTGKVGVVGYCLGGRLAFMCAARTDADASVGYYGVGLEGLLGEAGNVKKPLMLHIAEEDKFVDKAAQAKILAGLKPYPAVTIHAYPGCDHGFARIGGEHTDKAAAALADGRTEAFFRKTLA